jgi:hypothetical protein
MSESVEANLAHFERNDDSQASSSSNSSLD